jgi:hypothetical protein
MYEPSREVQVLRFGLLALLMFGLRAARSGDDCLGEPHVGERPDEMSVASAYLS